MVQPNLLRLNAHQLFTFRASAIKKLNVDCSIKEKDMLQA